MNKATEQKGAQPLSSVDPDALSQASQPPAMNQSPEQGPAPAKKGRVVRFLQEFSIPLIAGVFAALAFANVDAAGYHHLVHLKPFGDLQLFGHELTLHYLINDVFMVLFFGIAAKEVTEAALPGGSLNPLKKAINPLFATIGGVVGPVAVFFLIVTGLHGAGAFGDSVELAVLQHGWGIPTATDIALAWLVARAVFGRGHPAIDFLLLLAVADDAIGLGIIAIFYGDPAHPAAPEWLLLVAAGMAVAFVMRRKNVGSWQAYVFIGGPLAWCGLTLAHLHPALALVFIVPFLPAPQRDTGLFVDDEDPPSGHSPLHAFEHQLKGLVDFGLFFFAFANAGVEFKEIGPMTWTVLGALIFGKLLGIGVFGYVATKMGFPLPTGMGLKELLMAAFVASLGLTVALFVTGEAFPAGALQDQAKMGALFSGFVGIAAIIIGRAIGLGKKPPSSS